LQSAELEYIVAFVLLTISYFSDWKTLVYTCSPISVCHISSHYAVSLVGLEGGGGNVTRLGRFANYLRSILPHADVTLTEMTAKAIGQLALAEGTYTAEYVEFEVKRALEWILGSENKKLAAVSQ